MPKPSGTLRPIQYPLNRSADVSSPLPDENATYIDLSEWPTADSDERIPVILDVSLNEYVALATAIDVGRDISYGDNSILIWYIWVRSIIALDICQKIADCIDTSEAVQTALQNSVVGDVNSIARPSEYTQPAFDLSGQPICDNDAIYGYVYALWQYIDRNNQDFLQQMAEATNYTEQLAKFITLIPLADQLPVDEILGWVEAFGDYNLEAYNASITIGLEQEIICDLFCIAQTGCTITMQQVWDYFVTKFGGFNLPTLTANFIEWVSFMALGQYPNDRVVYMWCLFQLFCAFAGATFIGINTVKPYALFAQAGEPDTEWSILCTECGPDPFATITFDDPNNYSIQNGSLATGEGNPQPSLATQDDGPFLISTVYSRDFQEVTIDGINFDILGAGSSYCQITIATTNKTLVQDYDLNFIANVWNSQVFVPIPVNETLTSIQIQVFRSSTSNVTYYIDNINLSTV